MTPHRTAPRRTQAERRSESEDALLAAAAELVAERGLAGASLANIGERAGTSRGLPTHHFGSKDALVERLASRAQDRIQEALEQASGAAQPGQPGRSDQPDEPTALEAICRMVDVYLGRFEDPTPEERALLVLWGSTFPSSASVAIMHEADRRSYEGIADLVTDGHRDGSIRADLDPQATAVVILGTMRGTAALLITHRDTADARRVRENCQRIVARALGA
jgi:AcrR family transcriptional regulator